MIGVSTLVFRGGTPERTPREGALHIICKALAENF
jgi:hypothetical protein